MGPLFCGAIEEAPTVSIHLSSELDWQGREAFDEYKEARMSNRIKAVLLEANRQGLNPQDAELLVDIIEWGKWDELLATIAVRFVGEHPETLDAWREE